MRVIKQHKTGPTLLEDDEGRFLVMDGEAMLQEPTTVEALARIIYDEAVEERTTNTRAILASERGMFDMLQARSETLGRVFNKQRKSGGPGGSGGV